MTLDQTPLAGAQTQSSKIEVNLDDSQPAILSTPFSPLNPSSYSQSTSQTIYDTTGVSHTLSLYYQKNVSIPLTITPATGSVTLGQSASFGYSAKQPVGTNAAQVATTASSTPQVLQNSTITQVSGSTYLMTLEDKSTLTLTGYTLAGAATSTAANIHHFTVNTSRYSIYATLDGNPVPGPTTGGAASGYPVGDSNSYAINSVAQYALGTMAFVGGRNIDSLGGLAGGAESTLALTATTSGATPNNVAFNINTSSTSAYAGSTQTFTNSQDGAPLSQLSSYSFDASGKLVAVYSNGQSVIKGQVKLANFTNDEGLIPIGGNSFEQSAISGEPVFGTAGNGIFGGLKAQALEQSNVDLTSQLVTLMTLQRQYSASSQVVKTATALVDDVLNKLS
jgi:flagellar hook protein FlgE